MTDSIPSRVPPGIAELRRLMGNLRSIRRDLARLIRDGVDTDQRLDRLIDAEGYINDAIHELDKAIR